MDYQDTALICKNGHVINDSMNEYPNNNEKFCTRCGAEAIHKCDKCNDNIRGNYHYDEVVNFTSMEEPPAYCHNCGNAYEWTRLKMEALNELIELDEELDQEQKETLKQSGLEISTENPKNKVAVLKIKSVLSKTGSALKEEIKDAFAQVAAKTAVEIMKQQGVL
ncbi:MAG: DUF2321 domain-containing protein [Paraclostridium sp.]|uniref:DUF2321 domain-containing protein n=1 Tax=Paraclostridium sp. TaxID=2023273 RepID=UPI003EE77BFD